MSRQWMTLMAILLVYIPVAIDATVLHVAAPTLSVALGSSGNELLWIIDIYSLVMAGMVLPMGALGDRIGFKRLLMIGSTLFGLSSLAAAFAPSAGWLIAARASLAIGAAMIIPATLAGIRTLFPDARQRNIALGVWAAVGSGGAAFGPLVGGMLLGWIAGGMLVTDPALANPDKWQWMLKMPVDSVTGEVTDVVKYGASVAGALLVLLAGKIILARRASAGSAPAGH